ncbi:MAG: 3-isopropylmalate dehydratase small subunit, partial [Omnitrophica bacterium RIFCSPHIGHO2_02_FULL_46_11]
MEPFKSHRGLIATLDHANVDTDQIIPKQFLKSIQRTGFEQNLFYDWRYLADGTPNPDFELNQERFHGASILVTRNNFGCGSSREHAVWAIRQYGFKAVIAPWQKRGSTVVPAFADIFRTNSTKNGLLTVELKESEVEEIFQMVDRYKGLEATVNLEHQRVTLHLAEEISFHFDIDPSIKGHLVQGLDEICQTLQCED